MADYTKQTWINGSDTTPINAPRLGYMEAGIERAARQMHVGPTNQLLPGQPGLWIQTGLGENGNDMTFWVEDGA